MKFHQKILIICLSVATLLGSTQKSAAFALLGPIQPWMQGSNNVVSPGDIGGPMCLGSGYRWNVPVVTYGFDQSFLDFFGTNGVAAVESAIAILNALPPASSNAVTDFPLAATRENFLAQSQSLIDLKSITLTLLLEQMGLAEPSRYTFVLRKWNPEFFANPNPVWQNILPEFLWPSNTIPTYVDERNFDPVSLTPSTYINGLLYDAEIQVIGDQSYMDPFPIDPFATAYSAVMDFGYGFGTFLTGLTYDDVGGLAYLFSTNTISYENLLPGTVGTGPNSNSFINGAWRPGIDKIAFIPQPFDSQTGHFLPTTNYFIDTYLTNGVPHQQQLARTISRPDFLFSVSDTGSTGPYNYFIVRSGTTNWINNSVANGNTNGEGPGVIQPGANIIFHKNGPVYVAQGNEQPGQNFQFFGSLDGSTNSPITYPVLQSTTNQSTVRLWLMMNSSTNSFAWNATGLTGAQFIFQTSTTLTSWSNLFTITNNGAVSTYLNFNPSATSRFYRLIPQ